MKFTSNCLRLLSYLFGCVVALFLLGVGLLGLSTGDEIRFALVPGVAAESMPMTLIGLSVFCWVALKFLMFGMRKLGNLLFVAWNILVSSLLLCALVRPSYSFVSTAHFHDITALFVISLLALAGSWVSLRTIWRSTGS